MHEFLCEILFAEQYDYLGGSTQFSDEGIVPIKSVIGSLEGLAANGGYEYKRGQNEGSSGIDSLAANGGYDYSRGQSGASGASGATKDLPLPMRFYF